MTSVVTANPLTENVIDTLEEIYVSSLRLLQSTSLVETYKIIIDEALHLTGGKYASLFIPEDSTLRRVYSSHPDLYQIKIHKRGYTFRAFKENRFFLHKRLTTLTIHPEFKQLSIGSDLIVPLRLNSEPIGVISVLSREKIVFSERELSILKLFSPLASMAIHRATLFEELNRNLEDRDLFISMAAHELKTPLTTVSAYVQLISLKIMKGSLPDTIMMAKLSAETNRMHNLIQELLQVNRIRLGKLQFNFSKCNLKKVIENGITDFKVRKRQIRIVFRQSIPFSDSYIRGDYNKLLQVVNNLLENAAKYSVHGSQIQVMVISQKKNVVLTVRDHGKGIPREDMNRIYERFYKGKNAAHEGFGLGLYLVKYIVEKHGGMIRIKSIVNRGTSVSVLFPKYPQ